MKVLREIVWSILMVLFLTSATTHALSPAKESYDNGVEYAIQGKFKEAKEEFEKALKVIPSDSSFLNAALKESLIVAEDVINQKIKSKTATHLVKGSIYMNKGQWDEALVEYNQAMEINPGYAVVYSSRGVCYYNKGHYDLAISDYNKALEIDPTYAAAYNNRGFAYLVKLGDKVKGCADWKRACELGECGNYKLAKQKGYCQ